MSTWFLKSLVERAVKTFAQALVAVLSAGAADVMSVPWQGALGAAAFAALLSVLSSVASSAWGDPGTPSVVHEPED